MSSTPPFCGITSLSFHFDSCYYNFCGSYFSSHSFLSLPNCSSRIPPIIVGIPNPLDYFLNLTPIKLLSMCPLLLFVSLLFSTVARLISYSSYALTRRPPLLFWISSSTRFKGSNTYPRSTIFLHLTHIHISISIL